MLTVVTDENVHADMAAGLDEIVREGARRMPAAALETEVAGYIEALAGELDEKGHRLVVRNGHTDTRIVTRCQQAAASLYGVTSDTPPFRRRRNRNLAAQARRLQMSAVERCGAYGVDPADRRRQSQALLVSPLAVTPLVSVTR